MAIDLFQSLRPKVQFFMHILLSGVRQAIALVTSMEHSLAWERSCRQQAEEDVRVLLEVTDGMERSGRHEHCDFAQSVEGFSKGPSNPAAESTIKRMYAGTAGRKE